MAGACPKPAAGELCGGWLCVAVTRPGVHGRGSRAQQSTGALFILPFLPCPRCHCPALLRPAERCQPETPRLPAVPGESLWPRSEGLRPPALAAMAPAQTVPSAVSMETGPEQLPAAPRPPRPRRGRRWPPFYCLGPAAGNSGGDMP